MTVHKILRIGHPGLRMTALPVGDTTDPALAVLIEDMRDTMAANDGAGLAAPQIGIPLRVMIFGLSEYPGSLARYPDVEAVPETVLINPEFEVVGEDTEAGWEGCLSVPGMRGWVTRPARIKYRGLDLSGELVQREAHGFHARVFQHEFDHLEGVLYPDLIEDKDRFGFTEELEAAGLL